MKKIFATLLLALPMLGMAQQNDQPTAKQSNIELSLTAGIGARTSSNEAIPNSGPIRGGFVTGNANVLINKGKYQYGFGVDGNFVHQEYWELLPHVLINRKFVGKRNYFYAGALLGYANRQRAEYARYYHIYTEYANNTSHGYVFGIHGGTAYSISKHLALNAELALRSTQYFNQVRMYYTPDSYQAYSVSFFEASMQLRVGVRYRF